MAYELFLNEASLHGQYFEEEQVLKAVKTALGVLKRAVKLHILRSDTLSLAVARRGELLVQTANTLSQKDVQQEFLRLLFDEARPINWASDRVSSDDELYTCLLREVSATSMAELHARTSIGESSYRGALFNFSESFLAGRTAIPVAWIEDPPIDLVGFEDQAGLERWIGTLDLQPEYGDRTDRTPVDEETCLRELERFRATSLVVQGRRVYQELLTRAYWYVDNLHVGAAAHIEVFDKRGAHTGEATLAGVLDTSKRDQTKTLSLE